MEIPTSTYIVQLFKIIPLYFLLYIKYIVTYTRGIFGPLTCLDLI
jgi:hypothetical protein